jgi:hypothetical protein
MNQFGWLLILIPSIGIAVVGLLFVISYAKRDPRKEPENIEMLANVDKMEKEGKLDPQDAKIIRESV